MASEQNKPKMTPKDFFLWAGAMVSLYAGVVAFIGLLFSYINYAFRDPLHSYQNPYSTAMPYQMASLIILAPLLLVLMRIIRRSIRTDATRADIWVRRWSLYLTVFVAGVTIVVDLIVLLTTFLAGDEITTSFILKVLVVLLVAGGGFLHFISDVRGYWSRHPRRVNAVNYATGVAVVLVIVSGFFVVGTPGHARLERLDEQKVQDLSSIQYQIVYVYWQNKKVLPDTLDQLNDPLSGYAVPIDQQTQKPYTYTKTGDLSFSLCADFNTESAAGEAAYPIARPVMPASGAIKNGDYWEHTAGVVCFKRTIDPTLLQNNPNGKI